MFLFGRKKQQYEQKKFITAELRKGKSEKEIKLLLLGTGESGKSTMAKQMRIIHTSGFPDYECKNWRHYVYNNLFTAIRSLIYGAKTLNLPLRSANEAAASRLCIEDTIMTQFMGPPTQLHFQDIQALWDDPAIRNAYYYGPELYLSDSAYFLNALDRLGKSDYLPTQQDIIQTRAKTIGIVEIRFEVDGVKFLMVDVGGAKSERKKWIHCFQDVTAILFVAALNEYDMKGNGINKMHESLEVFGEICNSQFFIDTTMILFLNKRDLFEEKITRVNLNVCFEDYDGPMAYKEGVKFIGDKYLAVNQNPSNNVYVHIICATDTECITVIFNVVKDIILRNNALLGIGIL